MNKQQIVNFVVALVNGLIAFLNGIATQLPGNMKNAMTGMTATLKGNLKKFQASDKQHPHAPAQKPATQGASASLSNLFKALFQANGQKPLVYGVKTKGQFKKMRTILATAAKYGYQVAIGLKSTKLNIVVAPQGTTIPANLFVNGYAYVTAINANTIQGVSRDLLSTKAGVALTHAVTHITVSMKLAMPKKQATKPAPQHTVHAGTNGSQKPRKAKKTTTVNPLDPAVFHAPTQQPSARPN